MGAGSSVGVAMGAAFAVMNYGSGGSPQVRARDRRRKKPAQDANLVEDISQTSQVYDELHAQGILESAHQRQLAMDQRRDENRHVSGHARAGVACFPCRAQCPFSYRRLGPVLARSFADSQI